MRRGLTRRAGGRRGAVLPLVCVLLTVLLGAGALAIDLSKLYYVGQEVQTAADAAALAAMRAKQYNPIDWPVNSAANAQNAAIAAAAKNRAGGAAATVAAADVVPVAYNPTTRAITASSWGTNTTAIQVTAQASPTYVLGRVLGLTPPVVRRTATAWLASISGGNCVRPLAINYTRFYEEGVTWDTRYSSTGTYAPDFDQWDVANTQYGSLPRRTFTVIPPGQREDSLRAKGFNTNGTWQAVILGGGTGGVLNGLTAQLSEADNGPGCQSARAVVGDTKPPANEANASVISAVGDGMLRLCNRGAGSTNAWCYNTKNAVGVKARILSTDSVSSPSGGFVLRVREVGVVRIMCYFQNSTDTCNPVTMTDREANGYWEPLGGRYTGYPPGTLMAFIDSPGSIDITRDLTFGDKPGLTQRVLLVK